MSGARDAPPKTASRAGPSTRGGRVESSHTSSIKARFRSLGTRAWVNSPRFTTGVSTCRFRSATPSELLSRLPPGRALRSADANAPRRAGILEIISGTLERRFSCDFSSRMRFYGKMSMTRQIPFGIGVCPSIGLDLRAAFHWAAQAQIHEPGSYGQLVSILDATLLPRF